MPAEFQWTIHAIVFLIGIVALTGVAAWTDTWTRRIPNWLTLPMFALGWVYQGIFFGGEGLLHGLQGFALGFGTFFVLWLIGGGGGGDVKLMGALSVWLGFKYTLYVMVLSTVFVVLGTAAVMIYEALTRGVRQTQKKYLATGKTDANGKPVFNKETIEQKQGRRIMAYALPVALATWLMMLANLTVLNNGPLNP